MGIILLVTTNARFWCLPVLGRLMTGLAFHEMVTTSKRELCFAVIKKSCDPFCRRVARGTVLSKVTFVLIVLLVTGHARSVGFLCVQRAGMALIAR